MARQISTGFVFALSTALLLLSFSLEASAQAFRLPTFGGSSSESKENAPVGATAQGAAEAISAPYEGREYHIGSRLIFRPAQFKTEGALLGLCVLYLALHFAGKTINQSRARAFAKAATPMLNSEFFLVARVREDKDVMMWNGGDEAVMYASGRRGVDSLHIIFNLTPRHDPLAQLFHFVSDLATASSTPSARDTVSLVFTLPSTTDNISGVFALIDKSVLRAVRAGRYDLTFGRVSEADDAASQRALDNRFAIVSEAGDLTDAFLGLPEEKGREVREKLGLQEALNGKAGKYMESLVLTDQPEKRPEEPVPASDRRRKLILTLRIPHNDREANETLPLLGAVFNLLDGLEKGVVKVRPDAMSKFKRTRLEVEKELAEQAKRESKEEEEEARRVAKRKAEQDRLAKMTPAEQKKYDEVERKRQMRKAQGKTVKKR